MLKIVGDKILMLLSLTYHHAVSPPGDFRTRPSSNDVTPVDKEFFFSSHVVVNQPVLTSSRKRLQGANRRDCDKFCIKAVLISYSREDQGRADIVGAHLGESNK